MLSIIREEDKSEVENLRTSGANKDRIEGYLLFNGYSKKDSIAYLKEIGLVGRVGFKAFLSARLLEGYYSLEDFDKKIAGESDNIRKHYSANNNIRLLGNSITAKYDKEAAILLAEELANGSKSGKAGDSSEVVTKEAKKVVTKRAKKV